MQQPGGYRRFYRIATQTLPRPAGSYIDNGTKTTTVHSGWFEYQYCQVEMEKRRDYTRRDASQTTSTTLL